MVNKSLVYAGVGIFILILAVSIFMSAGVLKINEGAVKKGHNNEDLSKYRSNDIPEECRLPDYQNDLNGWKEHLGHHQNTLYCLDYYK